MNRVVHLPCTDCHSRLLAALISKRSRSIEMVSFGWTATFYQAVTRSRTTTPVDLSSSSQIIRHSDDHVSLSSVFHQRKLSCWRFSRTMEVSTQNGVCKSESPCFPRIPRQKRVFLLSTFAKKKVDLSIFSPIDRSLLRWFFWIYDSPSVSLGPLISRRILLALFDL